MNVTVRLVIFVGLIFHDLGSLDDFVGLYFLGVPTLNVFKICDSKETFIYITSYRTNN